MGNTTNNHYHITRITWAGVFGHETCHCAETGCAGDEMYLGEGTGFEVGRVYEMDLDDLSSAVLVDW